jgi:hypothetical protein
METNDGYEDCDNCFGLGYILKTHRTFYRCKFCNGLGKLDWVEKVTGSFESKLPSIYELIQRWERNTKREFLIIKANYYWAFGEQIEDGRFVSYENK